MGNDFINLMFIFLRNHSNDLGNAIIECEGYKELLVDDPDNDFLQMRINDLQEDIMTQRRVINYLCDRIDFE